MSKKYGSGMTAAEFASQLANDPEYQARRARYKKEQAPRIEMERLAEVPIVSDLRQVGVEVESVWDLVNTAEPYDDGLPVLIKHFESGDYPDRVLEAVGRALAVRESIEYWDRLSAVFRTTELEGQGDGAAVALAACATEEKFEELVDLVSMDDLGTKRIFLLRPIKKLGGRAGRKVLRTLVDDDDLGKEAKALLSGCDDDATY